MPMKKYKPEQIVTLLRQVGGCGSASVRGRARQQNRTVSKVWARPIRVGPSH